MAAMDPVALPANLLAGGATDAVRAWTATLDRTVPAVIAHWGLTVGSPHEPGRRTAWVAPARTPPGQPGAAQVCFGHPAAPGEGDGLCRWDGGGAVRVR